MRAEQEKIYSLSDIDYICKMMVELLKTSIRFMDSSGFFEVEYAHGSSQSLFISNQTELLLSLAQDAANIDVPVIQTTAFDENYLIVNLTGTYWGDRRCHDEAAPTGDEIKNLETDEKTRLGCFIVGPCLYSVPELERINSLMKIQQLPLSQKKLVIDYYRSLTVIDYAHLVNTGLLIHYLLYGRQLDAGVVITQNSRLSNVMERIDAKFNADLRQNKQNIHFHHTLQTEHKICELVSTGDSEQLMNYILLPQDGESGILSKKDALRSHKNLMICMITIITRAAIEGGLDTESAFTLSDLYIQQLEELPSIGDMDTFMVKAACDLANRVRRIRKTRYSANVSKCTHYISKHLYEEISLQALAELVDLHPNYLSTLLKKELGMPLVHYVQQERIEEAKRLLADTTYSLPEIAAWLNFHDQSHFTRIFKTHTGQTPGKFRNK